MATEKQNIGITYETRPDGISISNLVLKTKEYLNVLLRSWYFILLGALLIAGKNYYKTSEAINTFPARAIYFVKTQNTLKDNSTIIKIYSKLSIAENTLKKTLFELVNLNDQEDFLINHYIHTYQEFYPEAIDSTVFPDTFKFTSANFEAFDIQEKSALKSVLNMVLRPEGIIRDGYMNVAFDEKLGFITINFSAPTEELAIIFVKTHGLISKNMYYESAVFSEKISHEVVRSKTDSLREAFRNSYFKLEKTRDIHQRYKYAVEDAMKEEDRKITNQESKKLIAYVNSITKLDVATQIFKADYMAALEKLQEVETDENRAIPLITLTEETTSPIQPIKPSAIKSAISGAIMGGLLIIILLIVIKLYRDIMEEVRKEVELKQEKTNEKEKIKTQ